MYATCLFDHFDHSKLTCQHNGELIVGCVAQLVELWSLIGELSCPTLDL